MEDIERTRRKKKRKKKEPARNDSIIWLTTTEWKEIHLLTGGPKEGISKVRGFSLVFAHGELDQLLFRDGYMMQLNHRAMANIC
ncbi:hypothetical protein EUGRSUZ_E01211 [Eucalyptus grandis]|uniref:Uncharacterized protein n=2 Tax=Eucalyptus grandis TaxID=71139 RepID=A0ACC3KVX7_EUCGR|nr:hypothetical protein EUGRSUZ_E01211 [Eucalyptus grandis]